MGSLVVLGLGSNVGNRTSHLINAIRALPLYNLKHSRLYLNPAKRDNGEPINWQLTFYNMVVVGFVNIDDPLTLLKNIKCIERKFGVKIQKKHCQPRKIDIDLLFWDNSIINSSKLSVPHPEVLKRLFTVMPLKEIIPQYRHPITGELISSVKLPVTPFNIITLYNNNIRSLSTK